MICASLVLRIGMMKKRFIACILSVPFITTIAAGCEQQADPDRIKPILYGKHVLRRMVETNQRDTHFSAGFFLISGDIEANSTTNITVRFAWSLNGSNEFVISKLPIENIRVRLDKKVDTPTIEFNWLPCNKSGLSLWCDPNDMQDLIWKHVHYATINAKESDWPLDIHMPLTVTKK